MPDENEPIKAGLIRRVDYRVHAVVERDRRNIGRPATTPRQVDSHRRCGEVLAHPTPACSRQIRAMYEHDAVDDNASAYPASASWRGLCMSQAMTHESRLRRAG